jgi:hypothetical protein
VGGWVALVTVVAVGVALLGLAYGYRDSKRDGHGHTGPDADGHSESDADCVANLNRDIYAKPYAVRSEPGHRSIQRPYGDVRSGRHAAGRDPVLTDAQAVT